MKRVFAWVAALAMLMSSSFNVMASNEVSVSDGDLVTAAATTKDVEVGVEKGSTFTVSVPIIPPINEESYKTMEKSDGFFSDCTVTGDIASNEQIVVSVDEDVVFSPEGGLKDSVTWKAHTIPSASTEEDLNSTNIVNGKTKTIGVKLSKDMPAGLWRGYLHVNVEIDPYGSVLTAEQFKALIGNYAGEVNISIPKYVEIDGVQTLVRGIGEGALSGYPNLATVNLETDEEFYFEDSFKGLSTSSDTVVINGNSNVVKVSGVTQLTTKITFSNCTLYINGNPYVDSLSDMIDMSTAQYVSDVHGNFTELSLNQRSLFIATDCMTNASVDKLVIPEFVFNCVKSAAFRGSGVKEVEVSNDVVGDSWFEDCKDLTKVTLKDGVTTIRDNAFSGCTNLTDVKVPETVTTIGAGAFDGTPFLDKVKNNGDGTINGIPVTEVKKKSELVYSEDGKTLLKIPTDFEGVAEIKQGVTTIDDGAVEENSYDKVTMVKIPNSVEKISDDVLYRLNDNFALTSRIEVATSNRNFWLVTKITSRDDEVSSDPVTADCTYLMRATYRTVDNQNVYPWFYKVYDDGVIGIVGNDGDVNAVGVYPMYTAPEGMTFTFTGNGEVVNAIYYNKWTNSVQKLKWYNVTTPDYVEVEELVANGSTYWVNSPAEGVLLFSLAQEPSDNFDFKYVNVGVDVWDYSDDTFKDGLSLNSYSGDFAVSRGVWCVGDSQYDNTGNLKEGLVGLRKITIPDTVSRIATDYLLAFNEYAKSIVLEPDNEYYVLTGNDTSYTMKQSIVEADTLDSFSADNTIGSRWVVDSGVVRLQATNTMTDVPVVYKPVRVVAGTYVLGGASTYVRQCEVVLTDASGSPITSFGSNGSVTCSVGTEVVVPSNGYLFVTPIFNSKMYSYQADGKCLDKFVNLYRQVEYSEDGKTLLSIPSGFVGKLIIKDGVTTISEWVCANNIKYAYVPASVINVSCYTATTFSDSYDAGNLIRPTGFSWLVGRGPLNSSHGDTGPSVSKAVESYKAVENTSFDEVYVIVDGKICSEYQSELNTTDRAKTPFYLKSGAYSVSGHGVQMFFTDRDGNIVTGTGFEDGAIDMRDSKRTVSVWLSEDVYVWTNTIHGLWELGIVDAVGYSTDETTLLSVPAGLTGVLELPDTCTTIADGAFNYYDWIDDYSVYGKLTKLTIPKSVTTISDSELNSINAMFGEDERVQLLDGNTVFTVMSGTNGINTGRQVIKASDEYKPVQKMSWMDCDGVVYAHTRNQTGYDLAVKPVYFAEGSYTVTAMSSSIREFSFVATKSSGSRYVLSGASEDDDLLHSSNGTVNLTVPSGGLFIWTNITSNGSDSSLTKKTYKELFTVTKK